MQVIKDSREQKGWFFEDMAMAALATGDYTIQGMESLVAVERKGCVSELAQNVLQERMERELERLKVYKYKYIVCEFSLSDIMTYPASSNLPWKVKKRIRITGDFILKRLIEWQLKYGVQVVFVGEYGKQFVESLFKRIISETTSKKNS